MQPGRRQQGGFVADGAPFFRAAPRGAAAPLADFVCADARKAYTASRAKVLADGAGRSNSHVILAPPGGAMIRSELIQRLADDNPHLYQRDVERIVNTFFEEIINAMARGERVELRGFGAFSVKHRDARTGRNPRTGETVAVEEKAVPFFKTGKLLRDRLNGNGS